MKGITFAPTSCRRSTHHVKHAALLVSAALIALGVTPASASTTTLSNGAQLAVAITAPATGSEYNIPFGDTTVDVPVAGTASIGIGAPDAKIIYVMDFSGSTSASGGTCGTVLACEKAFFVALNNAVVADGSTANVGVVKFAASASVALGLTPPADPTVDPAITSGSASGGTNCGAGLASAQSLVAASPTNGTNIVVLASDGLCNTGPSVASAAAALGALGVVVHSVAIGADSDCTSNGGTGTLAQMVVNGGSCTEVQDPNNLPNIIESLIGSTLVSLTMSVDGGPSVVLPNSAITPDLPAAGAASVAYATNALDLAPGSHTICVTASGTDVLGDAKSTTECVTVLVLSADVAIVKTGPALVTEGNNYNYSLKVTNNGPSTATNLVVTDALPVNTTFVSASAGCGDLAGTVTCTVASLASGASTTFTITVKAGSAGSTIVNTGTVSALQFDPAAANNSSTFTTTLNHNPVCTAVTAGPDLWPPNHKLRSVTLSGATDADGDTLSWTVTGVTQDEPTNGLGDGDTPIDAVLGTGPKLQLRAERSGLGDGRVYRIALSVSDGRGGSCTVVAKVGVPHDQSPTGIVPVDSGVVYNSLA